MVLVSGLRASICCGISRELPILYTYAVIFLEREQIIADLDDYRLSQALLADTSFRTHGIQVLSSGRPGSYGIWSRLVFCSDMEHCSIPPKLYSTMGPTIPTVQIILVRRVIGSSCVARFGRRTRVGQRKCAEITKSQLIIIITGSHSGAFSNQSPTYLQILYTSQQCPDTNSRSFNLCPA